MLYPPLPPPILFKVKRRPPDVRDPAVNQSNWNWSNFSRSSLVGASHQEPIGNIRKTLVINLNKNHKHALFILIIWPYTKRMWHRTRFAYKCTYICVDMKIFHSRKCELTVLTLYECICIFHTGSPIKDARFSK